MSVAEEVPRCRREAIRFAIPAAQQVRYGDLLSVEVDRVGVTFE